MYTTHRVRHRHFLSLSSRWGKEVLLQQNRRSEKYFRIHHREALLVAGANPQRTNANRHQSELSWIWLIHVDSIPRKSILLGICSLRNCFRFLLALPLCFCFPATGVKVMPEVCLLLFPELRFGKVMPESFLLVSLHFAFLGTTKTDACRVSFLALLRFLQHVQTSWHAQRKKEPLDAIRCDAKRLFHIRFTELENEDIDVFRQSRLWAGLSKSEGI